MIKKGLLSILFWSIVSAAFIGPGTVATASVAGNQFGLNLLWALTFSTLACLVLQESAARIKIGSGLNLGQAIAQTFSSRNGRLIAGLVGSSVIFGCAAYQTGNMLGSVAGVSLLVKVPIWVTVTSIYLVCAVILWFGSHRWMANFLGAVVAIMGLSFISLATQQSFSMVEILNASFIPRFDTGSSLLVIGLVGTTIVPYNLFLAGGISQSQTLGEMRFGMGLAILLGGIISMAVLISATSVDGVFSFYGLQDSMTRTLGSAAGLMVGIGLFAAGFSSCLTAPLASAITAQSIFGETKDKTKYRVVWITVLTVGFGFGISGIKPIPAIIFAQALNGLVLPMIAIFLVVTMNNRKLLTKKYRNSLFSNSLSMMVVWASTLIGLVNLSKAVSRVSGFDFLDKPWFLNINLGLAILATLFTVFMIVQRNHPSKS